MLEGFKEMEFIVEDILGEESIRVKPTLNEDYDISLKWVKKGENLVLLSQQQVEELIKILSLSLQKDE